MNEPTAPDANEEKKGGGWGCLKIVLVLFAFAVLGMFGLAYYVSTTPAGQKVIGAAMEGYAVLSEGKKAPGMDALRAAGCQEALAIDMARLKKIVEQFDTSAKTEITPNVDVELLVHCQLPKTVMNPTCDEVAKVYIQAAKPQRNFGVVIQENEPKVGTGKQANSRCDGLYTPSGVRQSSLEELLPKDAE